MSTRDGVRRSGRTAVGLREARLAAGLTQAQLAAAVVAAAASAGRPLRLTASAVSRWEAGIFEPAPRYRPFLALVLGLEARDLRPRRSDQGVSR